MAIGDEVVLAGDPNEEEEEEELVDPQDTKKKPALTARNAKKYKAKLDECAERVSRGNTEETCEEELFDFVHCVDSCVAKGLFSQLK